MIETNEIWSQKAYPEGNFVKSLFIFFYEFISAHYTAVSFITLFGFFSYDSAIFEYILPFGIAVFVFLLFQSAFKYFWTSINLRYSITTKGILYKWGIFRNHEFFLPYKNIINITVLKTENSNRSAIVFNNIENITNSKYGFSDERFSNILSFENVIDVEQVVKKLEENKKKYLLNQITLQPKTGIEKFVDGKLYIKINQLIAFLFIYVSTFIILAIIDNNVLVSNTYNEVVVSQEIDKIDRYTGFYYLKTESGHNINLISDIDYLGKKVTYSVSPTFNHITNFDAHVYSRSQRLLNGYTGGPIFFKLLAIIALFSSSIYVFYHRGIIPLEDFPLFIIFPLGFLAAAYYLFY